MLQEGHCSQENSHLWATEWGYKRLFSSFSSSKAGVCILFNNNFDLQIMKTYIDDSGRFILCDLKTNGKSILRNIYAPNEYDPAFFKNLLDHFQDFQGDEIIIGGDFNLVLDVEKDKKGGLPKTHHNQQKPSSRYAITSGRRKKVYSAPNTAYCPPYTRLLLNKSEFAG